jgi:hypothetical protein
MGKVIGHKRLPFSWQGARNQNASKRLFISNLVETRPQRSELLPYSLRNRGVNKNVSLKVQLPPRIRALRPNIVETKKFCCSGFGVDVNVA